VEVRCGANGGRLLEQVHRSDPLSPVVRGTTQAQRRDASLVDDCDTINGGRGATHKQASEIHAYRGNFPWQENVDTPMDPYVSPVGN
jgi:hypothetical protein